MFFSSVSLAPHSGALMAGIPTSVTPTQPVGYATPSVGSPGDGPQRRTCARERKVGRRDQRRRALPAQVELITQVRRPQSGPRQQAGETCRGRNINRPGSPTGSGRVLHTFHFGGWVRLSSPVPHLPRHPPRPGSWRLQKPRGFVPHSQRPSIRPPKPGWSKTSWPLPTIAGARPRHLFTRVGAQAAHTS